MTRFVIIFLGLLLSVSGTARAEIRALVVGSNYQQADDPRLELANPIADARLISSALRRTVVDEITVLEEPTADAWESEFDQFENSLSGDDIAIFYFAGHGFQINGNNYLMAGDGVTLLALDDIMQRLTERAKGAVVIVDACRNNPLAAANDDVRDLRIITGDKTRSGQDITLLDLAEAGSGLAQLGNLRGLSAVVFFSTEPGNVAEDGDTPGKGSPFAKVFAREIKRRQSLDETFRKTAIKVNKDTSGRQSPWRQGDLPFNVFVGGMRALPVP